MENAAVGASMRSMMLSEALTTGVATAHALIFGCPDDSVQRNGVCGLNPVTRAVVRRKGDIEQTAVVRFRGAPAAGESMSTPQISDAPATGERKYCEDCGAAVAGRFCPECGEPTGLVVDPMGRVRTWTPRHAAHAGRRDRRSPASGRARSHDAGAVEPERAGVADC